MENGKTSLLKTLLKVILWRIIPCKLEVLSELFKPFAWVEPRQASIMGLQLLKNYYSTDFSGCCESFKKRKKKPLLR